jgi:hypothetical protein
MSDETLDELLSDVLDGTATPAQQAQVEADPLLRARLAIFTDNRERVAAAPSPVDPEIRDALITRALQALNEPDSIPSPSFDRTRQALKRRFQTSRSRVMTAVAAVALFVVGAVAVIQNDAKDSTDDTATSELSAEAPALAESQVMAADGVDASDEAATTLIESSEEGGTVSQESLGNDDSATTEAPALAPTNEDDALQDDALQDDALQDDAFQDDDSAAGSLDDETRTGLIEPLPLELSACHDAPTLELADGERIEYLGPSPEEDEGERILLILADGSEFFADVNLTTCALNFIEGAPPSRTSP